MTARRRFFLLYLSVAAIIAAVRVSSIPAAANGAHVTVLNARGPVSPVMAMYVDRGIGAAEASGAQAAVIQLDTPGGLDSSMRQIVQRIEQAAVPVAVYVAPSGARAASAGTFIVMAGNVAAMAPNTAIGAAHPVSGQGDEIMGPMGDKVTNDAAAYIRGIATLRGRNAAWAEQAVRESVSATSDEAAKLGIVDTVAPDLEALLAMLDGRTVQLASGQVTLATRNATPIIEEMTPVEGFLSALADPNVAYILLSLAMMGLYVEMLTPGIGVAGVGGGIALLLALFGLGMLPVNVAGLLLMLLAFLLLGLELWTTSGGLLTVGGVVSLLLGSFLLMQGNDPALQINPLVILAAVGAIGAVTGMIAVVGWRGIRGVRQRDADDLVGAVALAQEQLEPDGMVMVQGERWRARSQDGLVQAGERVRVAGRSGLELQVRRLSVGYDDLLGSVGVAVSALDPAGRVDVGGIPWDARVEGEAVRPGERVRVTAVEGTSLRVRRQA